MNLSKGCGREDHPAGVGCKDSDIYLPVYMPQPQELRILDVKLLEV